jgi:oligopeptide transport system substrate-binding protein
MSLDQSLLLNRRGLGGLALAALAAGCQGSVVGLDPAKRSLDIGNGAEPLTLDPHKASGQWENRIIGELFIGLTTEDIDANPIPGMATHWETSADGLTWTFHLREATWSDGAPLTARDFEYGFKRIMNPKTIAEYASILYLVRNAEKCKKDELPIDALGVRAVDDRTFEIRLEHPAPYLPGLMKHYTSFAVPAHIVEKHGDAWLNPENIVTNGPYMLDKWWSNYIIHLTKNPRFFEAEKVYFEHLYFYPTPDNDAAARRITRGELGWSTDFAGKKQDFYEQELPGWVRVNSGLLLQYYSLNTTKPPFNDKRVRQAVSMALDREFMCDQIWKAGYKPAYGFVPPGMRGWPDGAKLFFAEWPKERRQEEARGLLQEAGYGPNNPLQFKFNHRNTGDNPRIAVVAQNDWQSIAPWVKVELAGQETQVHYAMLRAKDFMAGDGGWIADFNDARNYLYLMETRTGDQNYPSYSNPDYDKLMFQSDNEPDPQKRYDLMFQAEKTMLDDCPAVPIGIGAWKNLIDPRVEGFNMNLEDLHRARWMRVKAEA